VRAVVVNLHVSATLTAVLPVKILYSHGILHAKLSYQYLTPLRKHAPRCRQISCRGTFVPWKIQRTIHGD